MDLSRHSSYESYLHYPDAANQFLFTVTDADAVLEPEDCLFNNEFPNMFDNAVDPAAYDFGIPLPAQYGNEASSHHQSRLHAYSLPNNFYQSAFKNSINPCNNHLEASYFQQVINDRTAGIDGNIWIDDYARTVSPSDLQSVSSTSNLFDETLSVASRSSLKRNSSGHVADSTKKHRVSSDSTTLGKMMSVIGLGNADSPCGSPAIQNVFVDGKGLRYSVGVDMNSADRDFSHIYAVPQIPPRQHSTGQIKEWLARTDVFDQPEQDSITSHALRLYAAMWDVCDDGGDPDSMVTIYAPRIGQKSYGTEKRLFCPPPMVHIKGDEFIRGTKIHASTDATGIKFHEACGGVSSLIDSSDFSLSTLRNNNCLRDADQLALFRAMFISDLSKVRSSKSSYDHIMLNRNFAKLFSDIGCQRAGKDFELHMRINHGEHLGTFVSDTINIISKPSKKKVGSQRQSSLSTPTMKNRRSVGEKTTNLSELIHSGATVAFYNRLKSQTVSTKYLALNQNEGGSAYKPVAKSGYWQPFVIKSCNHLAGNKIYYDEPVYLECPRSGWKSDMFLVRRVETKEQVVLPESSAVDDEAVLQLQKIALQSAKDASLYLSIHPKTLDIHYVKSSKVACRILDENGGSSSNDEATMSDSPSPGSAKTVIADKISDHCIWSAVAVSKTSYRYFRANLSRSLIQHNISLPVTPVPKLVNCHIVDQQNAHSRYHLIDMDVFFSASSVLEALDRLFQHQAHNQSQNFDGLLRYLEHDIYIGNVKCEILQRAESFLTESGKVVGASILNNVQTNQLYGTSLSVLMNKIVCRIPSLSKLVHIGSDTGDASDDDMSLKMSESDLSDTFATMIEDQQNNTTQIQLPIIMIRKLDGMVYRLGRHLKFDIINGTQQL